MVLLNTSFQNVPFYKHEVVETGTSVTSVINYLLYWKSWPFAMESMFLCTICCLLDKTKFKKILNQILKNIQKFQKPIRNTWVNMSAIFHFQSLITVFLLVICTCTYMRSLWPSLFDRYKTGVLGSFWKCARIGERLSPYVALCCLAMAFQTLFITWKFQEEKWSKKLHFIYKRNILRRDGAEILII